MNLHDFDIVIINSSAGKDSLAAMFDIHQKALAQNYPLSRIHVSHQDLGRMEWEGTKELAALQAKHFGFQIHYSARRRKNGEPETLLEYVIRHGRWPDSVNRWCTSDFKRGPGARVITALTKDFDKCNVLQVFGFRKAESPARSKKLPFVKNTRLCTQKRTVWDYLPIHEWETARVWKVIKDNKLPSHFAYGLGMPRLSCVYCIFSPFEALLIAAYKNPELLDEYILAEEITGHTFRFGFSLKTVRDAMRAGVKPKAPVDWIM